MEMILLSEAGIFALSLAGFLLANFLVFAAGGWWFFYRFLGPSISHRAIHVTAPTPAQIWSEIRHSFSTQVIFWIMGLGLWFLWKSGHTLIYTRWDERGVWYYL
jgi:hypothetical protein